MKLGSGEFLLYWGCEGKWLFEMGMKRRRQSVRRARRELDSLRHQGNAGSQGWLCSMKAVAVKERRRDHKSKGREDWTSHAACDNHWVCKRIAALTVPDWEGQTLSTCVAGLVFMLLLIYALSTATCRCDEYFHPQNPVLKIVAASDSNTALLTHSGFSLPFGTFLAFKESRASPALLKYYFLCKEVCFIADFSPFSCFEAGDWASVPGTTESVKSPLQLSLLLRDCEVTWGMWDFLFQTDFQHRHDVRARQGHAIEQLCSCMIADCAII